MLQRKRNGWALFALGVLLAGWPTLTARGLLQDEPDEMKVINRVSELVADLQGDDLEKRDAAEKELVGLGPMALDHLPSPGQEMSSDTQRRLQNVRSALETQAVERVSQPSQVSLDGKKTISDVLQAIQKQTGNQVVLAGSVTVAKAAEEIETGWEKAGFWTVLGDLQERSGLVLNPWVSEPDQLALVEAVQGSETVVPVRGASGVLAFDLMRIDATRNFANPQTSGMLAELRLRWEPRLRPIRISLPMASLKVIDEFDRERPVESPDQVLGTMLQAEIPQSSLSIPLPLLDRQVETIKSLTGVFDMTVPGRIETFEFPNFLRLDSGTQQTRAGATVSYEGIRDNLDLKELRISLSFAQPGDGMESYLGWAMENEVWLKTADGGKIEPIGLETWQRDEFLLGVAYLFPEVPDGATLVYRTPAAIVQLKVPFELLAIPLP